MADTTLWSKWTSSVVVQIEITQYLIEAIRTQQHFSDSPAKVHTFIQTMRKYQTSSISVKYILQYYWLVIVQNTSRNDWGTVKEDYRDVTTQVMGEFELDFCVRKDIVGTTGKQIGGWALNGSMCPCQFSDMMVVLWLSRKMFIRTFILTKYSLK